MSTDANRRFDSLTLVSAMALLRLPLNAMRRGVGYNPAVWRKFHTLSRVQVFVVSCVCAAVIAVPFAIASISHDETALFRDLFWPHQFKPLINYGAIFMSVLPLFLGYYQLGRIGALLSLAVSAVAFCVTALCAFCFFAGHAPLFGTIAYVSACVLLSMLVFAAHMKASNSRAIQDAQRLLRLISYPQTP